jgi:hypothetical protein
MPRDNWDNESAKDVGVADTLDVCRSWCVESMECVQYSLNTKGHCRHFHLPRLGKAANDVQSGWLVERVEKLVAGVPPC